MNAPFYEREIPSSLDGLSATIGSAVAALIEREWIDPKNEFCAHLCLEEALVNAIQHGNKSDKDLRVRLEMREDDDCCRIFVYDEGQGFSPQAVPEPKVDQPRGRGLCLIKHFMDHVEFHGAQRCLEMVFRRKTMAKGGLAPHE